MSWMESSVPARLYSSRPDETVQCHLSPRNCIMRPGQRGFCGVRMNVDGRLVTLNYGRSVHATQESIETEAVFHYAPGAAILSMGNIGCMMNCDYCHNWKTSQARFVSASDVHQYSPEQVVETALRRGIRVISWTYNDPVVWHEFVLDTSRLAQRHGIKTLFKSAFFISLEGAAELCDVIDIFSISIKSMDEAFYRRITKGWLPPVLEATKFVYRQGKHVEISNLMVTDANDSVSEAQKVARWVLDNLSDQTPVHFVRFHPDYKFTHVGRTPVERLEAARQAALELGIQYCYLGNVYDNDAVNTRCPVCGRLSVERYGLNARMVGLSPTSRCLGCDTKLPIIQLPPAPAAAAAEVGTDARLTGTRFAWRGDVKSAHLEVHNRGREEAMLQYRSVGPGEPGPVRTIPLIGDERFRFIVSKSAQDETGILIEHSEAVDLRLYEVFDRAHFPTVDIRGADAVGDATPAPLYAGRGAKS